jgi:endonuclease VIII
LLRQGWDTLSMEGPSLYLAQEQLQPFVGKKVLEVSGNSKIGIERMSQKKVLDIFSWGKHLVFQFDHFAMRIHFMLFGTFQAAINKKFVTGDYKKKAQSPRLVLQFRNGHMEAYSCSLKYIESATAKLDYNFTIDVLSDQWDEQQALKTLKAQPNEQIADVLLDQAIFAGVGNIIKNEILSLAKVNPKDQVKNLSPAQRKKLVRLARVFSRQFYEWRKVFQLRANLRIHRKSTCPWCGTKVIREKTGKRQRWAYYCPICQAL